MVAIARDPRAYARCCETATNLWLGAYGSGTSAAAAGWATRILLSMLGAKLADKVAADTIILDAHGTVFHAGPLSNGPLSDTRRIVGLEDAPKPHRQR